MVKRILAVALFTALMLGVAGCASASPGVTAAPTAPPDDAQPDADALDDDLTPPLILEYGDTAQVYEMSDEFNCYLLYPVIGIPDIDSALRQWALDLRDATLGDMRDLCRDYPNETLECELNVQYNDYLVEFGGKPYVGVEEFGFMSNNLLAHPINTLKTFNIDLEERRMLTLGDILARDRIPDVLELLSAKLRALYPDLEDMITPDETWLSNIVLTHGGVGVLLEQAVYLPSFLGDVRVLLSVDELGGAFLLGAEGDAPNAEATALFVALASDFVLEPVAAAFDPDKPMVALTFDDGPSKYTTKILDLLTKYGGRATFFQVGNRVANFPETEKAIIAQGSEIASHTWDHKQLTKLGNDQIKKELSSTAAAFEKLNVPITKLVRPPYGSQNADVREVAKSMGYALINWSVDTEDWKSLDAAMVLAEVKRSTKNGSIILCHDVHKTTAEAMEKVIPWLVDQGYQLVTVSELLTASGKPIEPGKVYYSR